tara:strand:- start:623 stop:1540 length:918 start_codon:yes stop_codon:yes gene_type:complete
MIMKKFIFKIIAYSLFLVFFVLVGAKVISSVVKKRSFNNFDTESNLLVIKENKKYDFLFMGISHARNFSRHKNHLRIDTILNKNFINIAQGGGRCGVNEQYFYLKYFYQNRNKTNQVVYILSPPMLFHTDLPIASKTFDFEPFEFNFFLDYLFFNSRNKTQRLHSYVYSKFSLDWINYQPKSFNKKQTYLSKLDSAQVSDGLNFTHKKGLANWQFARSSVIVDRTIQLISDNNSSCILIIPPALFGKWNGHNETLEFAEKMKKKYGVKVFDYSESVLEPKYYYDHHHLNSDGVVFFAQNYLKLIL